MYSWIPVRVGHHQFALSVPNVDTTEPILESSLVDLGSDFITFHTGVANGPVNVAVEVVSEDPGGHFAEWEVVTEVDLEVTEPLYLTSPAEVSTAVEQLADTRGNCRIRVHGRGRDKQWDRDVEHASEDYLIQLWRSERPSGIVQHKKIDAAWALSRNSPRQSLPRPVARPRRIQTPGNRRGSKLVNRARYSPAQVRGMADSRQLALLDQNAVDSIFALSAENLRKLAVWSAMHAATESGIADVDWVSGGLSDLVANNVLSEEFRSRAEYLSYSDDNSIPSTPIESIFDKRTLIREHMAVLSIRVASDADPLLAATQSLRISALVYGPRIECLMIELGEFLSAFDGGEEQEALPT